MARGGPRQGAPGKPYAQRTDMHQPVRVATGQPYGDAQQQAQAQQAVPLQQTTNVPPPMPQQQGQGAPMPALPGAQDFARPTQRPLEPVTAGLPVGAGPGPEVLSSGGPDTIGAQLVSLYQQNPNNDLLRLIELHNRGY